MTFLLAPNHYHNKALAEYRELFPQAELCTTQGAQPRLEKLTGLAFAGLTALQSQLPKAWSLLEPEGLKTGEVWLSAGGDGASAWFVVDAFGGGKVAKTEKRVTSVEFLKTFPKYGVQDKGTYLAWLTARLVADAPKMIVPCHGAMMADSDLDTRVRVAANKLLG